MQAKGAGYRVVPRPLCFQHRAVARLSTRLASENRYSSYLFPFPQLQSSQRVCRLLITDFPPARDGLDMVDVELHPVFASAPALDAPETVPAQHVITHRARYLCVLLVVGHAAILVL